MVMGWVARITGSAPSHCTRCGLLKVRRTKQFGYTSAGEPVHKSRWVCPRQSMVYAFDGWGRQDPTDCHGLPPWYCDHEMDAWRAEKPWWGACPEKVCPTRRAID